MFPHRTCTAKIVKEVNQINNTTYDGIPAVNWSAIRLNETGISRIQFYRDQSDK